MNKGQRLVDALDLLPASQFDDHWTTCSRSHINGRRLCLVRAFKTGYYSVLNIVNQLCARLWQSHLTWFSLILS